MTNDELLHKWINKVITSEELEIFKLRNEYEELVTLYEQTEPLAAPTFDQDEMLSNILKAPKATTTTNNTESSQTHKPKERKMGIPSWMKLGIAASLMVCGAYFSGLFNPGSSLPETEMMVLSSNNAGIFSGRLPDMSNVTLGANSELTYDKNNWDRKVNLKGEAFFKVTKGSKFSVHTNQGVVSVIGTIFNVKSSSDLLEVSCKEGVVQVLSEDYNQLLRANDEMKLFADGRSVTKLQFLTKMQKVTLKEVIDGLGYQYDRKVSYEGIDTNEIVTCNYTHTDLKSALKTSLAPLGIKYDISEKGFIVLSK